MKNKNNFLSIIAVLVVAAVAVWNVNFNSPKRDLADVSLAKVEALAAEILPEVVIECDFDCAGRGQCWQPRSGYDPYNDPISSRCEACGHMWSSCNCNG